MSSLVTFLALQFSSLNYVVNENKGRVTVTVTSSEPVPSDTVITIEDKSGQASNS